MLEHAKRTGAVTANRPYGLHWGNPETAPALRYTRNRYLLPFVGPDKTVIEIGPGGGRWTRYLKSAKTVYAVDYHQELLDELTKNVKDPNVIKIKNDGHNFPGIADSSIDFVFSFDVFVHLDVDIIDQYLVEMYRVMKPESMAVLHYSDKTKNEGFRDKTFSSNCPEIMRSLVRRRKFKILDESLTLFIHSAIMLFAKSDRFKERHSTI
jgi:ubiquinone/menaquinone biosynthesis C-methylase UbiE